MGWSVIFLALAFFVKIITPQYIGNPFNPGLNYNGLPFGANFANSMAGPSLANAGLANPGFGAATSGGGFVVTSSSSIAPTGVSILAENLGIEGPLSVGGQLPFLGTIGLEGALPAIGLGAVSYGRGNGNVGINSEGPMGAGAPGPFSLAGQSFGPNPLPSPNYGTIANTGLGPSLPGYGVGISGPSYPGSAFNIGGPTFSPGFAGFGGSGLGGGLPGPGIGFNGIPAGAYK